jgi:hypothetical protein
MESLANLGKALPKRAFRLGLCALAAAFAPGAQAATILVFGQQGVADTITGTQSGPTTTITATNAQVQITTIDPSAGISGAFPAFFNFSATNSGPGQSGGGSFVVEPFTGSFTITSGAGGAGTNYLSGNFTDAIFGAGPSLTLSSGTPGGTVNFTSSVISTQALGLDRAISLGFTNVGPPVSLCGTAPNRTLCSFRSNVSGNFSAAGTGGGDGTIPEPASLALIGIGLAGMSLARLRRGAGAPE